MEQEVYHKSHSHIKLSIVNYIVKNDAFLLTYVKISGSFFFTFNYLFQEEYNIIFVGISLQHGSSMNQCHSLTQRFILYNNVG